MRGIGIALAALALSGLVSCARPAAESGAIAERPSGAPQRDFARAVTLQGQGRHLESVAFFRSAAEADPENGGLHLELAKALHNASIQMDFSGHGVRYVVARSQDRAQLRHQALAEVQRAVELAPDAGARAFALYTRARLLDQSGDVAGALVCLDSALALMPDEPVLHQTHALLDGRLHPGRAGLPSH